MFTGDGLLSGNESGPSDPDMPLLAQLHFGCHAAGKTGAEKRISAMILDELGGYPMLL
jgi:hypothetical protein